MSDAARRWDVPAIDGSADSGYLTAGRLEALQKEAHEEAFRRGYDEGLAAGRAELERRTARLDELLSALARPFEELDDTLEKQLVKLSMSVVQQLFRRELRQDPGHVVGIVREALQMLPAASRDITVTLHPEDAALVRETLSATEGARAWSISEDPLMARGGCKVTTRDSGIDAQAESRLNALIASIAGDERQ